MVINKRKDCEKNRYKKCSKFCYYSTHIGYIIFVQALRHLRQIVHEVSQSTVTGWGRRPAALRALSQRLSRLASSIFLKLFFTSFGILVRKMIVVNLQGFQ